MITGCWLRFNAHVCRNVNIQTNGDDKWFGSLASPNLSVHVPTSSAVCTTPVVNVSKLPKNGLQEIRGQAKEGTTKIEAES